MSSADIVPIIVTTKILETTINSYWLSLDGWIKDPIQKVVGTNTIIVTTKILETTINSYWLSLDGWIKDPIQKVVGTTPRYLNYCSWQLWTILMYFCLQLLKQIINESLLKQCLQLFFPNNGLQVLKT